MRNREEKKKCKGQESTIGKIIYSFLLFLPLFAIGVTCGYAMLNKNAYQSKADTTYEIQEKITTNDFTELVNNTTAFLTLVPSDNYNTLNVASYKVEFKNFTINNTTYNEGIFTLGSYVGGYNGYFLTIYDTNFNYRQRYPINNYQGTYQFYLVRAFSDNAYYYPNNMYDNYFEYFIITSSSYTLDNIFYYSIDKVQKSPLFNWAENSIIYTTTATTCNALSITTPFIPLLMSYWLIISVIYFLYDIALMLVWIIHRKIHELQESI